MTDHVSNTRALNLFMMYKDVNKSHFKLSYYIDERNIFSVASGFNRQGIPLVRFYATGELVYNPTTVALFALASLQRFLLGEEESLNNFKKYVEWLSSNGVHTRLGFLLSLNFDYPNLGLKSGWLSAMTQGLAISCFIRYYIITKNEEFLKLAYEASKPLMKELREGGVSYLENEELWFEEVPLNPPSHILNGFIYALMGLYDLYCIKEETLIGDYILKAIYTLERNIMKYDSGYWSKYQLNPDFSATYSYHKLHIKQLLFLLRISQRSIFKDYAIKFTFYMKYRSNYLKASLISYWKYLPYLVKQMRLQCVMYVTFRIVNILRDKLLKR